jgi:hypothetical protein
MPTSQHVQMQISILVAAVAIVAAMALLDCQDGRLLA